MSNLHTFILAAFTLSVLNSSAQEINTELHGKKMSTFIQMEKKLGGKIFHGDGDIIIPQGMEMPLTYRRKQIGTPDLIITYTFSKVDSLINNVKYEWDTQNFNLDATKQPLPVQKALIKKYQTLADELNRKYGRGEQEGDLIDLTKINLKGGLTRSDQWYPNDTTYISMYSMISNFQESQPNSKLEPSNRIVIFVNKIKKPLYPELRHEAIWAAKECCKGFFVKLRAGDFEGSKAFLSSQIRNQMTEAIFNKLKATIKPEPLKVYFQDKETLNGINYLMIQYTYSSASEQPNEILKVLFDKDNLIIGLQPLVRKEPHG